MRTLDVTFFGKIPSAGDYVRYGIDTPWRRRLFDCFVDGWSRRAAHLQHNDLAHPVRVLLAHDEPGKFTVINLYASRDKVGRRFPFAIGAELAIDGATLGEALLIGDNWLQRTEPIAQIATRGLPIEVVRAHVDMLRRLGPQPDVNAHRTWRRSVPITHLRPETGIDMRRWLRAIAFSRAPTEMPEYISRGECAPTIDAVSATVDLCNQLGPQPVHCVAYGGEPEELGTWRLLCNQLAPRYIHPLLWHEASNDLVWSATDNGASVPDSFSSHVVDSIDPNTTTIEEAIEAARHAAC